MIPDAAVSPARKARLAFGLLGLLPLFGLTRHCTLMRPGAAAPTFTLLSRFAPCGLVILSQTFVATTVPLGQRLPHPHRKRARHGGAGCDQRGRGDPGMPLGVRRPGG